MQFQILGTLEAHGDGNPVALGPAKQRTLLAILLVHANELVSSDRLIEELWPQPPETAANTLQVYVGRLRKALEPERRSGSSGELLVTRAPGYSLRVEPGQLDSERFETLLEEGRRARERGDHAAAAEALSEALGLWRGDALAEFAYEPFAQGEIARLEELRTIALEERLDADLALGRDSAVLSELETLVREHPLRERLRGQLMLALYRCGRQADALEAYGQAREILDEELGLAPSPELQRLQTAILRQEPGLEVPIEAPVEPAASVAAPAAPADAAETRKTVTVLVARGLGTRSRDPEALSREDERYRAQITATVERYGGTIVGGLGNAVMAVFGVPRVHEDDALRAAAAALEITGAETGAAVRAGIATGEVLTGPKDLSVVGTPVDAAGELEEGGTEGEVLLGEGTERLLRGSATVERLETDAGVVWRLLDLDRERPAVGSLRAPLVGRERELARLRRTFGAVTGEGALHLLTILGTAGIGKSRLAQELAALAADEATVLVGRCVPYGEGITFWPLREMLSTLTSAASVTAVPGGRDAQALAEELEEAIGTAEADRDEIFWATRRLFEALARERPLVLFVEDAHWAEPTFLDLVEYLAERGGGFPILLVCIARPELLEQRPGWGGGKPDANTVALEPLSDADCETLIGNLARGLGRETTARVLETAEGNPLFIEQLVAHFREGDGGGAEPTIPPTIAALLLARLDRLGPGERAVIGRAAVVGKEFSAEATVDLLPEEARGFAAHHLDTLARKEMIAPAASPGPGEDFRFRHILIRDAAYRTTPKSLRAELHEHFAEWSEDPAREGFADASEIAGYHLEQAFRYRAELGSVGPLELQLARRASDRLASAGSRTFQRGDMPATVNLLGRAAALPSPSEAARLALLPDLGYALFEVGEVAEASRLLADAGPRASTEGDRHVEWRIVVTRPRIEMYRDPEAMDLDAIAADCEQAIEALTELGDDTGLARAAMVVSDIHWSQGRLRETSAVATQAAEYARRAGNRREVGWALGQNALCAIHGPMPVDEGLTWLQGLLDAEPENRTLDANLAGFVTVLEAMSGRIDDARGHIADSRALARDLGLTWQAAVQELLSGYVELMGGDPVAAERDMRAAQRAFREVGEGWFLSTSAVDLPRAVYEQGRYEDACELLAVIDELPAPTDFEWRIKRTGVPARLLARRGRLEEAERLAREGVAIGKSGEFVVLHADVLLDLAEVLRLAGRPEEAADAAEQALALYDRKGVAPSAASARSLVEELRA